MGASVDRAAVKEAISDFVTNEILLLPSPLGDDEDMFDAGFDSMSLTRLLVFVEKRFGILIESQDVVIDEVSTITTMSDFVFGTIERAGAK